MPIIKLPETTVGERVTLAPSFNEPDFSEVASAAWERGSIIGSYTNHKDMQKAINEGVNNPDPNYDPFTDMAGYEQFATRFVRSYTPQATHAIKTQIDKELTNQRILSDAGWAGVGMEAAASILDPVSLAVMAGTGGAGFVAKGASFAGKVARAALMSGVGELPIEAALQETQITRSSLESVMNVGGATLFGGLVGGSLAHKLSMKGLDVDNLVKNNTKQFINRSTNPITEGGEELSQVSQQFLGDAGAAMRRVGIEELEDLALAGKTGKYVEKLQSSRAGKAVTISTPIMRTMTSPLKIARNAAVNLFENAFIINKNYGGNLEQAMTKGFLSANMPALVKRISREGVTKDSLERDITALATKFMKEDNMSPAEAGRDAFIKVVENHTEDTLVSSSYAHSYNLAFDKVFDEGNLATQHSAETMTEYQAEQVRVQSYNSLNTSLKGINTLRKESKQPLMSDTELSEAIGRALITGSDDPSIVKAAAPFRAMLNEIADEAEAVGMFPEDFVRDPNYLPRVWNIAVINEHHDVISNILTEHILGGSEKAALGAAKKVRDLTPTTDKAKQLIFDIDSDDYLDSSGRLLESVHQSIEDFMLEHSIARKAEEYLPSNPTSKQTETFVNRNYALISKRVEDLSNRLDTAEVNATPLTKAEAKLAASEAIENIKGNGGYLDVEETLESLVGKAGFSKARTIDIENTNLINIKLPEDQGGEVDFISTNIENIMSRYSREMLTDINMNRAIQNIHPDWEGWTSIKYAIDEEVKSLVERGMDATAARSYGKDAMTDLTVMRARLKGRRVQYNNPTGLAATISKGTLALNSARLLGGTVVSAITDLSRPIARNGLGNTLGAATEFLKNKVVDKAFFGKSAMNQEQMEVFNIGLETILATRSAAMADITGLEGGATKAQLNIDKGVDSFFKWSGMNAWNDGIKTINGYATMNDILKSAEMVSAGKKVPKDRLAKIAQLGLGKKELEQVLQQYKKYGEKSGLVRLANTTKWDDIEIRDIFTQAMYRDSKITVITPSVGDKPLWFDANPMLQHVSQFQSFGAAANNRALIAGLQGEDGRFLQGLVAAGGFTYLSLLAREAVKGEDKRDMDRILDMDTTDLVGEILDRSGYFNQIAYARKIATPMGIDPFGTEVSRYAQQNGITAWGGPSIGLAQDAAKVGYNLFDGSPEDAVSPLRRMMPFQNLFYARAILDGIQTEAEEALE